MNDNQQRIINNLTGKLDIRFLKENEHSLIIPIPDNIISLIGHVAILWGAFEHRMDIVIETFFQLQRKELPENWKRLNFRKRKALYIEACKTYLTRMFPESLHKFLEISQNATDLHIKRNIIVHGYVEISSDDNHNPKFISHGFHKGKAKSFQLTEDFLEELRHSISHLSGNMMAEIYNIGGRINGGPEILVPDKELLLDAQEGSFQILPISNTKKPLP